MSAFSSTLTARKAAEARAGASELEVRKLIGMLPDGIIVEQNGKVSFANDTLACMVGVESGEQLIGRPAFEYVHPDDRPELVRRVQTLYAGGTRVGPSQFRLVHSDGTHLCVESFGVRVDLGGQQANLAVLRDITKRTEMEERLRTAERMATLGSLAAGVTHEINNPLATLRFNLTLASELLAKDVSDRAFESLRECIADSQEAAEHMSTVVRGLSSFARAEGVEEARIIELVTAIGHAATLARFELRRVRGFAMDVDRSLRVRVREGRLVQVLLNLLVNAAQATRTDHPHEVSVIARRSNDGGCSILVRDTGDGMRADMLARVFEPFFTSKPAGQGTGLGLPISRTLVEEMDGRLSIESVFDVGTTVRIELPLVEG